jgi:hypothetical protein
MLYTCFLSQENHTYTIASEMLRSEDANAKQYKGGGEKSNMKLRELVAGERFYKRNTADPREESSVHKEHQAHKTK